MRADSGDRRETILSTAGLPVVVGVDASESAIAAARWAGAVAETLGTGLRITHATPSMGRNLAESAAAIAAAAMSYRRDAVDILLKEAAEAVHADHPTLAISTEALDVPADKALIAASLGARMVVLGGGERAPAMALLVGSTTLNVASHASCPVVAWRGNPEPDSDRAIVVGMDFTAAAETALLNAFALADSLKTSLRVVYSWPRRTPAASVTIPFLIDWEALEAAEWTRLADVVDQYNKRYPAVSVKCFVEPAGPAKALLLHAADAQLVVVGTRGRNAIAGALLGSTSMNLLHHSNIPVMICRPGRADTPLD